MRSFENENKYNYWNYSGEQLNAWNLSCALGEKFYASNIPPSLSTHEQDFNLTQQLSKRGEKMDKEKVNEAAFIMKNIMDAIKLAMESGITQILHFGDAKITVETIESEDH